ncbi:serine/threonine-protein phosphatase 7 long form-like protein [Senna tora]|uniref:Serine/threonine-protein phosphatase 7 long form-like protein n=1 Tax=Senna tora TaxID=362788 RepID=A0A834X0H1_9FABA|nr:serine/threonine-protein phosphatase 7 long form-like protein [Senna tora]
MWAWDHFPWLALNPLPYHDPHEDEYVVPPPLGIRWSRLHRSVRHPLTIQRQIQMCFDQMIEDDIVWRPFQTLEISQHYNQNPVIWRAQLPLICFHILEWHHLERVMRQFGFDKSIPKALVDLGTAYTIKLFGKTMVNWSQRQHDYAALFADWPSRVCTGIGPSRPLWRHSEYMQWYNCHTRRWIDPTSATSRDATNVIEYIRQIARPINDQLGGIIDKKCNEALHAIGEITETLTFNQQRAPEGPTFGNPPMPPGGTRRGTRGFHVARDPIMPVVDFDMGAMPSQPHIPVSPPHVDSGGTVMVASSSSSSTVSGSVSSSSATPRAFSFFGGSNQLASVKLDRSNYLIQPRGQDSKAQCLAPTDNSSTANSEQEASSESRGSVQMNLNPSARGESSASRESLVNQDLGLGRLESISPNNTASIDATHDAIHLPAQVEMPQAQPETIPSRHHIVTRARDGITKPKYPFIGLLKCEDPFDKASQSSEPSNRFNMLTCAPVTTPMVTGRPFSAQGGEVMADPSVYRRAIGSL